MSATRNIVIAAVIVVALGAAFLVPYALRLARLIDVGGVSIDPAATIREDRDYDVVVWDQEIPLPWAPGSHRMALEEVIADLVAVYPNVHIEVSWFPWETKLHEFRQSIASGDGPDIAGLHGGGVQLSPELQVPVDPYMADSGQNDWMAPALEAVHVGAHIWAWPRWVSPARWVADRQAVPSLADGPSTYERVVSALTSLGSGSRVALAAHDPRLFFELMVALTGRSLLNDQGEVVWQEDALRTSAAFLERLRADGLLAADLQSMGRNRLRPFTNRNVTLLAPINPWATRFLLSQEGALARDEDAQATDQRSDGDIVLLAPPAPHEDAAVAAEVSAYAVFRRPTHAGDDHTKMVMQVAEALSRRMGLWEATHLLSVPAHPSSLGDWRRASGLSEMHANYIETAASRAVTAPVAFELARYQTAALAQVFAPSVQALLSGSIDAESFAATVSRDLQGLRAELYVP